MGMEVILGLNGEGPCRDDLAHRGELRDPNSDEHKGVVGGKVEDRATEPPYSRCTAAVRPPYDQEKGFCGLSAIQEAVKHDGITKRYPRNPIRLPLRSPRDLDVSFEIPLEPFGALSDPLSCWLVQKSSPPRNSLESYEESCRPH